VENFWAVANFQMKLKYNSTYLQCVGYTDPHPSLEDNLLAWVNHAESEITLQWACNGPEVVTFVGQEKAVELVFSLKQTGQGQLDWYTGDTESYFVNGDGVFIPTLFQAGMVTIYAPPQIYMEDTIYLCEGQRYTIQGAAYSPQPPISYLWSYPDGHTSEDNPHFDYVTEADEGDYTLLAIDSKGCIDQKSVHLIVNESPVALFHGIDTLTVQPGYILDAGSGLASYQWNTGETTPTIVINDEGLYSVELMTVWGCIGEDSIYMLIPQEDDGSVHLFIPNAFSPNGDGMNETFKPIPNSDKITNFKMVIYNRWGQWLWETDEITRGWDGTTHGVLVPEDVYVYKIVFQYDGPTNPYQEKKVAGLVVVLE
jgi:gliding motility-associated-like protein